jgi:hypothetical protein
MFNWLKLVAGGETKKPDYSTLLNVGLSFALEFGENWLEPIQARMSAKFPMLAVEELDALNTNCQAAMNFGHDLLYSMAESEGSDLNQAKWQSTVSTNYPWINTSNMNHLFSQGMYYAWKDGIVR